MGSSSFRDTDRAALSKSTNLLSGDVNEFVGPARVNVYAVASALGMRMSVFADDSLVVDDKEIPNIGTSLAKSDHLIDSFAVGPGTRIAVFLRETANVATTDTLVCVESL